jgi:hypothetical protein
MLAQLFAHVGREFNWGICLDGRGTAMFRYYTSLSWFRKLDEEGMFEDVTREAGEGMKDVFSKLFWSLHGSCMHASHFLHECVNLSCFFRTVDGAWGTASHAAVWEESYAHAS